jgi:hypothetical protein
MILHVSIIEGGSSGNCAGGKGKRRMGMGLTSLSRDPINGRKIRGKRNAVSSQAGCSGDSAPYHAPGIEKKEIFEDDLDREGFVNRMGKLALETRTKIYAWSLITNHVLCCAQHK